MSKIRYGYDFVGQLGDPRATAIDQAPARGHHLEVIEYVDGVVESHRMYRVEGDVRMVNAADLQNMEIPDEVHLVVSDELAHELTNPDVMTADYCDGFSYAVLWLGPPCETRKELEEQVRHWKSVMAKTQHVAQHVAQEENER